MPKKNARAIQIKVITEMNRLCYPRGGCNWSILKAAYHVEELWRGQAALVSISMDTARRWFKHWLDFGKLPCEFNHKKKREDRTLIRICGVLGESQN